MLDAGRQRRMSHRVEHDLRRLAAQQIRPLCDLLALPVELHMPAEIRAAF